MNINISNKMAKQCVKVLIVTILLIATVFFRSDLETDRVLKHGKFIFKIFSNVKNVMYDFM